MTTTCTETLEEIVRFTPTEELELLAALVVEGTSRRTEGLYGRLAAAALGAGLITPEGKVTEEGHAFAARYEEKPLAVGCQRLFVGGSDESVPGPFATPNVRA